MFSKVLGKPQPDWHRPTLQTGFCFYDGQKDLGTMPEKLTEFLDAGEPPIVFTLGSAAVMDARDFFEESIEAAQILEPPRRFALRNFQRTAGRNGGQWKRRLSVLITRRIHRFFRVAACVVHQGGVGTTAQVFRAGVPHLIMPYSHDQPDNAARCKRIGVAETISRDDYTADNAAEELKKLLGNLEYKAKAIEASKTVKVEHGTRTACDAIELVLK